jgi:cytidine deaminase
MLELLSKIINSFEIELHDTKKNEEFYKALRQVVTILFGVVLGIGLSQLAHVKNIYDGLVLGIAYFAILSSWWGYHWGVIAGPKETNLLNYVIDCLLLICYWVLINKSSSMLNMLLWLFFMFSLYSLWEMIRSLKKRPIHEKDAITNAFKLNTLFALSFLLIYLCYTLVPLTEYVKNWFYLSLIIFLLIIYRRLIHPVYLSYRYPANFAYDNIDTALIKEARLISAKAKAHISRFPVGAAILSNTGNIYVGCNVEFDNFSNTIHAEESAISALIAAGEEIPVCIAVYTSRDSLYFPCGLCRQSLFELGGNDLKVIACNDNKHIVKKMRELLPEGFHL